MRILQVSTSLPFRKKAGGAEKLCYELSKRLMERGHNVELAVPSSSDIFRDIKLHKLYKVRNKYLRKLFFDYYNPQNVLKMKKIIKDFQPDIVHFHSVYGLSSQLVSYTSSRVPTVVTAHDYWPFCYWCTMTRKNKPCNKKCNTCSFPLTYLHKKVNYGHFKGAFWVAPSQYMERQLKEVGGFKNVKVIYNGIELSNQRTNYKKNILWVGRICEEKGLQTVISILDKITEETEWKVQILGDGPLKKRLENHYKNVDFMGFQNPKEFYLNSSILIISSIWPENLPYAILEAMNYGLTVVGSKIGGIPELIEHKKTGLLFNPSDEADFKEQLNYLLKDLRIIEQMGKNATSKAKEKFSWDRTIKSYLDLYKQLF